MAKCAKCGSEKLTEQPCPHCGGVKNVPRLSEFMVRGVPLGAALDAQNRWVNLTRDELTRLGFDVPVTH